MQQLSKRLTAVAAMVSSGSRLADIGTDHAYVPIRLVQEGRIPGALAMDVKDGPLARAREHIREQGLEQYIQTRKSDGLVALQPGEADTVLMAGMGGLLMIRILEAGHCHWQQVPEWILQPQSKVGEVRRFVREAGFTIEDEDFVEEDGKYYPMMRLIGPGAEQKTGSCDAGSSGNAGINVGTAESWSQVEYAFGKLLLQRHDPVLREFLLKEKAKYAQVRRTVSDKMAEDGRGRVQEIDAYLALIGEALAYDGM